ncbi:MAG: thioredoxin domain-containing protein [Bacteroidetes bacterium]|nr:thioredoxin domain-containing protein [Bacteroidota bacterium]
MALFIYRTTFERLLYILALAGVGLTLHIALWYSGGASGSGDPFCGVGSNCVGVIADDPAPLGLSSAWWGFLFYMTVFVTGLLIAYNVSGMGVYLKRARAFVVGAGWCYSLFLTLLQATAIDGWCQLCLVSFVIVTLITLVTFMGVFKRPTTNALRAAPASEKIFHGAIAVLLLGFLTWDYNNASGQEEVTEPIGTTETEVDPASCMYVADAPVFDNLDQIIMDYDLVVGPADAPIMVMEFLDPNCNHCKAVHPHIKALAAAYPDSVRVVFKPIPIVGGPTHSLDEITALYLADEEGVFEEMLDLVFQHQSPATGLSVDQLSEFAEDLDMDEANFRSVLRNREYASRTVQTRRFFEGMGFTGVPAVIINGRQVSSSSRNLSCLRYFVEQAKAAL